MRKQERLVQMTGPMERQEIHIWQSNPIGRKLYDEFKQYPYGTDNGLDTCHDFWIKARPIAKSLIPDGRKMDAQLSKFLKRAMLKKEESIGVSGLSHTSALERWGGR